MRTAVAGDTPPLVGLFRPLKPERFAPSHVLVRGPLHAVPFGFEVFGRGAPSRTAVPAAPSDLNVPSGYDPTTFAAGALTPVGHPHGVRRPYSGHDPLESGSPGVSMPRHLPPSAFLTPSTVCSSIGLPTLFRSVPLLGFTLQSLAPFREAVRLSTPMPSCRFLKPRSSTLRFSGKSRFTATSGPCSPRTSRTPRDDVPPPGPCSPGFVVLQGSRPMALTDASARRPPRTSACRRLRRVADLPVPRGIAAPSGQTNCLQPVGPPELLHRFSPSVPPWGHGRFQPARRPVGAMGVAPHPVSPTRRSSILVLAARLSKRHFNQARLR